VCVRGGGGGAQTILRVPTISSLSSKARVRVEVESETKARHARCVSVSSTRSRSKKNSSGVGHQWRAIGHLDHAAVEVLVLEGGERAGRREHDEYAK